MTAKQSYWITDISGAKGLVVGVEERDRWLPLGWSETSAPAPGDRVWMEHAEHGGRQVFAAEAVDAWSQLGWAPSPPPEPLDVTRDPAFVDQRVAGAVTPVPEFETAKPRLAASPTQEK